MANFTIVHTKVSYHYYKVYSILTNKNSQSDTFFPKLKNTIVKIDIKSFSVLYHFLQKWGYKI